uniref:CSON002061 protein n=1 Tax=Culicoides sonorensis TaxID=179676 RepID=A0A336L210_CULSO
MESTLKSSQSVASSVTSDSETETWEVIDDKQKKNSDDEKEEKQQENKQENPKITIDKAESVERLSSDDNDDTSQTKTDVDACQECASTENESSLNVRRASHGNRIEDEFSDGISVISESELECNETHSDDQPLIETMDNHPKKDLILKSSSEMVAVPAKKSCILTCLRELFANNQFATVAILSILVAILGGIFCQLSMILNGSQIPLSTTTNDFNLLVCQNKITELEGENANLKIEVTILQQQIEKLQNDLNLIKLGQVQGDQPKVQAQQSGSRTKVQGKGKKVKTKYDQFKRPPVAAGGEEETIIHVDKSQIHEELQEDSSWKEYLEPIKSLWDDETPLDINEILNEEPSSPDLNDFEPIQPIEVLNEATPQETDLNLNENMKNEVHERQKLNENDKKFPEHDNQERKFDKNIDKSKNYNENVKKNKKYDQNERNKNQKGDKIQSHEDSSGNAEVKNFKNENKRQKRRDGSGSNEKYDKDDHKKYRKESENNHSGERKYQNNDKRQKRREGSGSNERFDKGKNDNNKKYYKNKENRENSGDSDEDFKYNEKKLRKQSAFDDSSNENEDTKREFSGNNNKEKRKQQKKKNYDENRAKYNENDSDEKSDKNWHEDRMKNREKYRNKEKEENWYIERKQNREKHREERDKDSNWYMERNLERELLRSREMNSKEKSK